MKRLALWGLLAGLVSMSSAQDISRTPAALRRPADQTYLTYAEWFLVFSPDEYADWVETHPPTDFPFLGHVADVWGGYLDTASAVPEESPPNWGYHAMIWSIAGGTTVEYGLRSIYESTVGRVTAATVFSPESETALTAEDRYGAEVARDYERFIRQTAWYEFDYAGALARLWTEVPFTAKSPLRALERRYALTTEYILKLAYAKVLATASHATFDPASFTTQTSAIVTGLPDGFAHEGVTIEERFEDGAALLLLPRYEAFTPAAVAIARAGGEFVEVAGNSGRILVSVIARDGYDPNGRVVRREAIRTRFERERVLFDVPIAHLSGALLELGDAEVEHVYDF